MQTFADSCTCFSLIGTAQCVRLINSVVKWQKKIYLYSYIIIIHIPNRNVQMYIIDTVLCEIENPVGITVLDNLQYRMHLP
jgi:hypothetical protein